MKTICNQSLDETVSFYLQLYSFPSFLYFSFTFALPPLRLPFLFIFHLFLSLRHIIPFPHVLLIMLFLTSSAPDGSFSFFLIPTIHLSLLILPISLSQIHTFLLLLFNNFLNKNPLSLLSSPPQPASPLLFLLLSSPPYFSSLPISYLLSLSQSL